MVGLIGEAMISGLHRDTRVDHGRNDPGSINEETWHDESPRGRSGPPLPATVPIFTHLVSGVREMQPSS
jgi:hypothetical protein